MECVTVFPNPGRCWSWKYSDVDPRNILMLILGIWCHTCWPSLPGVMSGWGNVAPDSSVLHLLATAIWQQTQKMGSCIVVLLKQNFWLQSTTWNNKILQFFLLIFLIITMWHKSNLFCIIGGIKENGLNIKILYNSNWMAGDEVQFQNTPASFNMEPRHLYLQNSIRL